MQVSVTVFQHGNHINMKYELCYYTNRLHVVVIALADSHMKHMDETHTLVSLTGIIAVHSFVYVTLQISLRYEVVRTEHHAFEVSPKAFNAVGGDTTLGILLDTVVDDAVDIARVSKPVIGVELVGEHHSTFSNELLNDRHKRRGLSIGNLKRTHGTLALHHTENRSLRLRATPLSLLGTLGFVLIGFPAAKVHFIHLYLALKGGSIVLLLTYSHG